MGVGGGRRELIDKLLRRGNIPPTDATDRFVVFEIPITENIIISSPTQPNCPWSGGDQTRPG